MQAPVVLRRHADLATGLARLGRKGEASELIAGARGEVARDVPDPSASAVTFQLHRAEAVLRAADGDPDRAVALPDDAERGFAALGQPLEQGECLLVRSAIERRRRRFAPARQAASAALALFAACEARRTQLGSLPHAAHESDGPTGQPDANTAVQVCSVFATSAGRSGARIEAMKPV